MVPGCRDLSWAILSSPVKFIWFQCHSWFGLCTLPCRRLQRQLVCRLQHTGCLCVGLAESAPTPSSWSSALCPVHLQSRKPAWCIRRTSFVFHFIDHKCKIYGCNTDIGKSFHNRLSTAKPRAVLQISWEDLPWDYGLAKKKKKKAWLSVSVQNAPKVVFLTTKMEAPLHNITLLFWQHEGSFVS